jgi:hypothetical protein
MMSYLFGNLLLNECGEGARPRTCPAARMCRRVTVTGMETRSRPYRLWHRPALRLLPARPPRSSVWAFIEVPASFCVDRSNSGTPSRYSSYAIVLEVANCPRRSCLAAPENEPASMTRKKASMAAEQSTASSSRDREFSLSGQE